MQYLRQLNRPSSQSGLYSNDGGSVNSLPLQGGPGNQMPQQRFGFTKQQLHVLKAQILAFRRLKKGEGTLPQELLRAIAPPPLELQPQRQLLPPGGNNQDRSTGKTVEDQARHVEASEKDSQSTSSMNGQKFSKEASAGDEKVTVSASQMQGTLTMVKDPAPVVASGKEEPQTVVFPVKSEQEVERSIQKTPVRSDYTADKGKAIGPQVVVSDSGQVKKPVQASTPPQSKDLGSARKYHGPLFDFPFFTRKHDSYGSATPNSNNNLTLAYDVKDLLFEEGLEVLNKKRSESLKKIGSLLAVNLERKRIRPDLVLRLQIEEKKLRLLDVQARLRDEVDQQQQEIMAMPDRPYRKFVRLCERQRMELTRQVQANQKAIREKQLKSIFQWRKKLLEAHWAIRDARMARNRGVAKYHERMLREFSKRKDDDRNKRMEALKNNDVERYREMLLEQQTSIPGDAAERYAVLSSFLSQTENYLHKLGSKITAAKSQQEVEEAANAAAAAARLQGLSEEEVRAAATCAGEEVMIRNRFMEMNAPKDGSSVSKYYSLAHAVNEKVARQPSMLRAGTLRDYQLVGLQWMLSLYNNKLNGILADEMGLGKTVQVMALIAYLMEFKGNYGPHLIIVPNAVLVNWKSEFHNWLPSVSCIFYVGGKDQRSKLFSQEVCAMKFNVLVTTYEFIMYDRSKLSKLDWKYIIIDEAQRMKDRESVLARDLDRYRCQRRLLLTGTPLQNDLKELWSLLNLLLPEVFDNRKAFHDWFSQPFQKEGPTHNAEDDWLETEKKVIIIHRLHQILEPFMLRRRVEDVEGSLPPKVSIVLRCRMSAFQSAIYDWIKSTGTLRVDPEDEKRKAQKNPIYQAKVYRTLNNRCMELRKACNHPLLNYPYLNDFSKDFLVRSCGKLWILDRILIKLQRTGHRVLLFSTMTKLLDILEEYLQWRRLIYRRIDGTTSLEDRESAIVDFNSPESESFIFLLSIRAAGRGLNLQSADTVIIYDPDPNPKNEEQAVARAHRIGQTREVKVIYMEAVVDKISSHQKEDELRSGGSVDLEDDFAGKDRYMGSIESLIRNNIQQYKIDMADEVINAGRFDQRTTHEERRMTLETLLHDEERYQETVHDVPSLQQVNRMIARSEDEVELFDQMDEDLDWTGEMTSHDQVPKWLRASKGTGETPLQRGESSLLPFQMDHKYQAQLRTDNETMNIPKHEQSDSSSKIRRNLPARRVANTSKVHASPKSGRSNCMPFPAEDAPELSRDSWDGKAISTSGTSNFGAKMSDGIQRRFKNVISKLQRRIDKEGQQIVPMLTSLWKRMENSSHMSGGGNNLLDLRRIDHRVDRLEYNSVMELVSDVQFMLKGAMQFYGFSHEVRSEARKVHNLFFEILKIPFPDTDFREAKAALSFAPPVLTSTSTPSPRQGGLGQGKRHKPINDVEPDPSPLHKPQQRGSVPTGTCEETRVKGHMSQKESRLGSGSGSGSGRELSQPDDSPRLAHPGELVICKKKRKDREKSVVKPRTVSAGPVSPPGGIRSIRSLGSSSVSKDLRSQQQAINKDGETSLFITNGG
ncbi:ATP-dependent helicase BRM, partial [Carica papaya]|uniref:ATP-dependent helicase BRM n=1 Tax=Carica papaya TaxID=3649 RepID=UPI000B8CE21C